MTQVTVRDRDLLADNVRRGLSASRGEKFLSCQFLYDEVGSALFEAITYLPEYGLTRAEERILQRASREILNTAGPCRVAELGSGSGRKTRLLLSAGDVIAYHPIDVSPTALSQCQQALNGVAPVEVICADYLEGLREVRRRRRGERLLLLFLGSTIGNFAPQEATVFLHRLRGELLEGDLLLLGADLVKASAIFLRAYDDPTGVTAAFNRNLLARINRQLHANFDLRAFHHEARYDDIAQRVEMHLRATSPQQVLIRDLDLAIDFEAGESIWTESSYKFRLEDIDRLAGDAGYTVMDRWLDREWGFAETLLTVPL